MLERTKSYNEPIITPRGDKIPKIKPLQRKTLSPLAIARLELETNLRICGLTMEKASIKTTSLHQKVLRLMLKEFDSPMSASFRSRSAAVAGPLKLKDVSSTLCNIALDESEDLATRIGAITSYLQLNGKYASKILPKLLHSKSWQVRATSYTQSMNSNLVSLKTIAEGSFKREKNPKVKNYVNHRVYHVRTKQSTIEQQNSK